MADTEAARTDMRFARKFLENKQFNEARDYIAGARAKDPDVTLAVKTESKTVATLTPNLLEADILEQQSLSYAEQINTLNVEHEKYRAEALKEMRRNQEKLQKLDDPKAHEAEYIRQMIEWRHDDQVSSQRREEFNGHVDYLRSEITKCLEQAIKLNPQNPNLYAFLGRTYLDQKYVDNAVELLRMAQEHWPEHFEIRRALDSALKEQQLQHSLKTAPVTSHLPPSLPVLKTRTTIFILSTLVGIICFLFATQGGSGHETALLVLVAIGISCFFIAFLARPKLREQ
jgi:tetratricopeptide (TPR) repeat protein